MKGAEVLIFGALVGLLFWLIMIYSFRPVTEPGT